MEGSGLFPLACASVSEKPCEHCDDRVLFSESPPFLPKRGGLKYRVRTKPSAPVFSRMRTATGKSGGERCPFVGREGRRDGVAFAWRVMCVIRPITV